MRFLLKAIMNTETANQVNLGEKIQEILSDIKPEAAYFVAENGKRCAYLIVNMDNAHQLPSIAEPFFHGLKAEISITPVMKPEDLQKASANISAAAKKYQM